MVMQSIWFGRATGWSIAVVVAAVASISGSVVSQTTSTGRWPMEVLELKDGRTLDGLIESIGEKAVEFVEIRRPRGKPMFLVVRPIDRASIVRLVRLEDADRLQLEQRIARFKNRALIEAGRMENVELAVIEVDGARTRRYQGEWFSLDSTLGPEMTRRTVVRLEQMFLAFRQVLPPRRTPQATAQLQLKVFGTNDEYFRYLRKQGIFIRNPAYFDAAQLLVVGGSDVQRVADQLAATRTKHEALLAEMEKLNQQMPGRLVELKQKLSAQGVSAAEQQKILTATKARWDKQRSDLEQKISRADARNAAKFDLVVEEMLSRLYHESFHAYLEDYVYESRQYEVPRWLNEGLAQIFEAGLLEADTLRIDTPEPNSLAALQEDLRGESPLRLADVLTANQAAFMVPHRATGETSARHYLYSWGLAYYLTFEQSLLGTRQLDRYVASEAQRLGPQDRFEQLIEMPLDEFERQWREDMLKLAERKMASR